MIGNRVRQSFMLIFIFAITALGLFQMFMRINGTIPSRYMLPLIVMFAVIVAVWVVLCTFQRYSSQLIFFCVILLSLIGITEIIRIDHENRTRGSGAVNAGMNQIIWLIIALVICAALSILLRNYRLLRKFSYTSMVIGILLMFSPMVPGLGKTIGGARIWIGIGSHTVQPAEFAKLFIAVFFAGYLFDHRDQLAVGGRKFLRMRLPRLRDLGPILIVWALCMGVLVLQRDLGTSLLFFAMFVCMLYVSTGHSSWILIGLVFFGVSAAAASRLFGHVQNRITAWLHPFDDSVYPAVGGSEQLVKGIFGLSSGGTFGTGLGKGHPGITPLANSDFIFSSLGEELGLTGILAILSIYLIIIAAGIITALKIKDGFGKLLIAGLVFTMAFQVFIVVGGITLVIPLTGLTLPYMAAGGSSLTANMVLAFIILIVSNDAHKPQDDKLTDTVAMEALEALQANEKRRALEEAIEERDQRDAAPRGRHAFTRDSQPAAGAEEVSEPAETREFPGMDAEEKPAAPEGDSPAVTDSTASGISASGSPAPDTPAVSEEATEVIDLSGERKEEQ